jgi:hypothetical protein
LFSGIVKEQFMNIGLKHIGVSLLFILGAMNASADPGGNGRFNTGFFSAFPAQRFVAERGDQRNGPQLQGQGERRGREFGGQDASGFGNQGSGGSSSNANASDNARRQGRMSPEERRALRRQIDEAGHDIYRPRR